MIKQELEIALQDAFNKGFWPKEITKFQGATKLNIKKTDDSDTIFVFYTTLERNGREHSHQFIYGLSYAAELLKEYHE